ncbi:MAG: hypothetical protein IMY67_05530 [Bacteroidetes bacterium]|nr:hypothetical protein [Bacteroidota bacterium]
MKFNTLSKYKKLLLSILFDALGYVSFIIPGFGEFIDIIWAPVSAWLMLKMYKGNTGKIAGVISFIEEILPGFDVIPTFTLTWIYTYIFRRKKK